MNLIRLGLPGLIVLGLLAGCSGSGSGSSTDAATPTPPVTPPPTDPPPTTPPPPAEVILARGCFGLQSAANGGFVVSPDGATWAAVADSIGDAEPLFLQAATIDKFMVFSRSRTLLTESGGAVGAQAEPSDAAIWEFIEVAEDSYQILSDTSGGALTTGSDGALSVAADTAPTPANTFRFVQTTGCETYPEMPTGIAGETYKGRGVDQPVIGFADVHTHMGMSHEMSYDDSVGPSAGGVLYGRLFHRFGVPHALEDCEEFHGPDGIRDANNILAQDPTGMHDTVGWPFFVDWPARNFLTHQVMYYRWVERAYKAGLRLMTTHGTNIASLCQLGKSYAQQPDADCDDMSVATKQVQHIYDIQDYIDAQHGGAGKGWYRIVKSPAEAREVINDGKLAVVLGVEIAQVFDCGVTILPDGSEQRRCDQAQIDQKLDELHALGVRQIFTYHDIDSSLGGTGIFNGDVINFLNFLDTGTFWTTYDCPAGGDEDYLYNAGAIMTTAIPGSGSDPLSQAVIENLQGPLPTYPPDRRQCNARAVTDLGAYAIEKVMERKMVMDIDHAELSIKQYMLDVGSAKTPPYPLISAHGGHGGISNEMARQILRSGGLIYPYKGHGRNHTDFVQTVKALRESAGAAAQQYLFAVGYGADANGFGGHPGPRGGDATPVTYPFTLFRGAGWGERYQSLDPLSVELLTIPESGKFWNIDEVGMANYGLVADFVEEVRLEGGAEALDALYNSAEAYIQMWERIENR